MKQKTDKSNGDGYRTIRVRESVCSSLHELQEQIRSRGWVSLGIDRADEVSLSSLIEEGLRSLAKRGRK